MIIAGIYRRIIMVIAGIGSRSTPQVILNEMIAIGAWCRKNRIYVRSGHAGGADLAFELGAQEYCIAYIPWAGFNAQNTSHAHLRIPQFTLELEALAEKYHPAWHRCDQKARRLHMRNGCQVLGESLNRPVDFVVCYTVDGSFSGGTGQAMRIAQDHKIPIINMYTHTSAAEVIDALEDHLDAENSKHQSL